MDSNQIAVIGVDPGLSGAVALYVPSTNELSLWRDFKTLDDISDSISLAVSKADIPSPTDVHFFIEFVHAFPGQGVTSMFNFGKSTGVAVGTIRTLQEMYTISHNLYEVSPQKWQMWVKMHTKFLPIPNIKNPKVGIGVFDSRVYASAWFPKHIDLFTRVKDHGSADAALIALYGSKHI